MIVLFVPLLYRGVLYLYTYKCHFEYRVELLNRLADKIVIEGEIIVQNSSRLWLENLISTNNSAIINELT